MKISPLISTLVLALVVHFTSGCHTVIPATRSTQHDVASLKHAHVVISKGKERGFLSEIEKVLKGRGVTVTRGTREAIPAGTQFYVIYEDKWAWDMVMYPEKVTISFHDPSGNAVIGSAGFKNSLFHTYPDPPEISAELIGQIYGDSPGTHMK